MSDQEIRKALKQHWTASDTGDFAIEHDIYHDDAVLDYPQSRERIIGRHDIQMARTVQPNKKDTEYVLTYDSQPFYTVSIREFRGVKVAHETQYFAAPFEAGESRRKWVVNMDSPASRSSVSSAASA